MSLIVNLFMSAPDSTSFDDRRVLSALVLLAIVCMTYLIPSFIGFGRKHPNAPAICVLNVLLGWTVLGWIAALVWAATSAGPTATVIVNASELITPRPDVPRPAAGSFCQQCGERRQAGAEFCIGCGRRFL